MRLRLLFVLSTLVLLLACGADDSLFGRGNSGGAGTGGDGGSGGGGANRPPAHADRMDILLTIDNSRSMADKQEILSLAVPELIGSLLNPRCVDGDGVIANSQPATPDDDCPVDGTERQFPPIRDIHVGVISTSIGGHGSDACPGTFEPSEDDRAHLLTRGPGGSMVNTYQDLGFLAWDPDQQHDPPGEINQSNLEANLKGLVTGAGQLGCGFEATHEAWYRFLVEPDPYETVSLSGNTAVLNGTDGELLKQRQDFLRPDSLLAIIVLSDENDCSIRDGGQFYFAAQLQQSGGGLYHLPKPRAACALDPNDPCCRSCGQEAGPGCSEANDDCTGTLNDLQDHANLRCFDQKRRFGVDFLYPIQRYVDGLTETEVQDRHGDVVRNPLFEDLNPSDSISEVRDERLVFLTNVIGVPWQDLARRGSSGNPDLIGGLDADGKPVGGFQSAAELTANDTWDLILGDPAAYVPPTDPLMVESVAPRSGQHPITGEPVAPPGANTNANSINGHEFSIPLNDELQYACVFDLSTSRDCSLPNMGSCACEDANNDNPVCQDQSNLFGTVQFRAFAYPGIRHLQVAKALDNRGVVGSICPSQISNGGTIDFGYVPTVRALVSATAPVLK